MSSILQYQHVPPACYKHPHPLQSTTHTLVQHAPEHPSIKTHLNTNWICCLVLLSVLLTHSGCSTCVSMKMFVRPGPSCIKHNFSLPKGIGALHRIPQTVSLGKGILKWFYGSLKACTVWQKLFGYHGDNLIHWQSLRDCVFWEGD